MVVTKENAPAGSKGPAAMDWPPPDRAVTGEHPAPQKRTSFFLHSLKAVWTNLSEGCPGPKKNGGEETFGGAVGGNSHATALPRGSPHDYSLSPLVGPGPEGKPPLVRPFRLITSGRDTSQRHISIPATAAVLEKGGGHAFLPRRGTRKGSRVQFQKVWEYTNCKQRWAESQMQGRPGTSKLAVATRAPDRPVDPQPGTNSACTKSCTPLLLLIDVHDR